MKYISIAALLIVLSLPATSCDYCNCYLGLNPHYKKNLIGIRNHFSDYVGSHYSIYDLRSMGLSEDDFWERRDNIELHAQYYPVEKIQVLLSMPYVINTEGQSSEASDAMSNATIAHTGHSHMMPENGASEESETINGIGDPLLIAQYQLFNFTYADSNSFAQRLLAGGGFKMPLGNYSLPQSADPLERVHQPGSGSWDFLLSSTYLMKLGKFGSNINASYLFTNSNNEGYKFGNRLNVNGIIYYKINASHFLIYPNAGIYYEHALIDQYHAANVNGTGGNIYYLQSGMDFYLNRFSINLSFQLPVAMDMNPYQPELQYKLMTGFTYSLN
jgi:hypothetical protein